MAAFAKEYSVTLEKHGRIWSQLVIHYDSGHDGKAQISKADVENVQPGETIKLRGYIDRKESEYGTKSTFICVSEEESLKKEEERWIGYFREHVAAGKFYSRAVDELHKLGIHDYDKEFEAVRKNLEAARWIGYFREHIAAGNFYPRAVTELHALGVHDYDDEIERSKKSLKAKRDAEYAAKREEERNKGIKNLVLPAYHGFHGRPTPGSTIMHGGVPYRVVSSYYHNADGYSFGANNEEWYSVKAKDITDTDEGRQMLKEEELKKQEREDREKAEKLKYELSKHIRNKGSLYAGPKISANEIPGVTVWDTFDIYGGGELIRVNDEEVWAIINNGSDGADWSINTIRTGGAGAYAFVAKKSDVVQILSEFAPYAQMHMDTAAMNRLLAMIADDAIAIKGAE